MTRRNLILALAVLCAAWLISFLLPSAPKEAPPLLDPMAPGTVASSEVVLGEPSVSSSAALRLPVAPLVPEVKPAEGPDELEDSGESQAETLDGLVIRIEDATGLPLPGALVTLDWRRGWGEYFSLDGVTDAGGEFQTSMQSAFQVEDLSVRLPEHEGEWTVDSGPSIGDPRNPQLLRFIMPARVQLEVRVRVANGRSAEGAEVKLESIASRPLSPGLNELWSADSAAEGVVDLSGVIRFSLDARAYRIQAADEMKRLRGDLRVGLAGGDPLQAVDLLLEPRPETRSRRTAGSASTLNDSEERPALTGFIVDAMTGAPVPGASLSVVRQLPKNGQGGEPRSDAQGKFTVTGVYRRAGQFLFARERDHAWAAVPIESVIEGQPITLAMEPKQRLEGRAVDADGAPVDGWASLFTPLERVGLAASGAGLDDSRRYLKSGIERIGTGLPGTFHFNGATRDYHRIWFQPEDPSLPPGMTVARGGDMGVVIQIGDLPDGLATVRGILRDSVTGEPAPGLWVNARGDHTARRGRGLSDEKGAYLLAGLEPGEFTLSIEHQNESAGMTPYAYKNRPLTVRAGEQELDFEVAPARTLQLRLFGGTPFGPLRLASVSVLDGDGDLVELQSDAGYQEGEAMSTDWNGRVDLLGVPAEKVELLIWEGEDQEGEPDYRSALDATRPLTDLLTLRF
ncbi:MAG: hypothetical protein ACJAQ3_003822 [Planctomycetota bacterium]|jgi:hypothetical protein